MSRTVIVGCGATKQPRPAPAGQLYTGSYARACMAWAESVTDRAHIYILSAKYGLVPWARELAPYDLFLGQPGSVTVEKVARQIVRHGLRGLVLAAAGSKYVRLLTEAGGTRIRVRAPFAGAGGMGYQMRALKESRGAVPA